MRATADDADDPGVHWEPPTASSSQREFGFGETAALASYLARLAISHLCASPYLKARPGRTHGYGVTDHDALHPKFGRRGRSCTWGGASRERAWNSERDRELIKEEMGHQNRK